MHWHERYRPPLAIGDSTMLFALPSLGGEGFDVNAHGCRQFPEAIALLRALSRAGRLPHLVVVALGADGSVSDQDIQQTLAVLGSHRVLVLVTPLELGGSAGPDAATVRRAGRHYRDRIHVLDWVAFSRGHGDWFQPDGLHLTFAGADAFARLLRQALAWAAPPAPLRCRSTTPQSTTPGVAPAQPLLTTNAPGGILEVDERTFTTSLTILNSNPFALTGTALVFEQRRGTRSVLAQGCVNAMPMRANTLRLSLTTDGIDQVERRQRVAVALVVTVRNLSGASVQLTSDFLLERPVRRHK